ncbi:MAG: hypothetical protein ABW061_25015 [Polyangiaceae bacterium]
MRKSKARAEELTPRVAAPTPPIHAAIDAAREAERAHACALDLLGLLLLYRQDGAFSPDSWTL